MYYFGYKRSTYHSNKGRIVITLHQYTRLRSIDDPDISDKINPPLTAISIGLPDWNLTGGVITSSNVIQSETDKLTVEIPHYMCTNSSINGIYKYKTKILPQLHNIANLWAGCSVRLIYEELGSPYQSYR